MSKRLGAIAAALLGFAALSACVIDDEPRGPLRHDPVSIDMDKSEMVRTEFKIGAGKLEVRGGAAKLLEGDFTYNVPSWKPRVDWVPSSFRGLLTVSQPEGHGHFGHSEYEWNLRLNDDKPMDVKVELGAGEADLELGSLNLRGVDIEMGVGKLMLDLKGAPKNDYNVRIHGGVGEATVYFPAGVGVSADAKGGIGGIHADGMHKDGSHYTNDAWPDAKVRIRVDVEGGIGAINLIAG